MRALLLSLALLTVPSAAQADLRSDGAPAEDSLAPLLAQLESCLGAEQAVAALGERWEQVLASADWDPAADGPRRFADRVALPLRSAFLSRRLPRAARHASLELLVQLAAPVGEPLFERMLEVRSCPPPWTALAADGLARLGSEGARRATAAALVAAVPGGAAPDDAAWALCGATARVTPGDPPAEVAEAARRLFLFAPQIAVQACMPLVSRLPDARALAERVLDGTDWPIEVDGPDPRERRMLEPYARGAALILLGNVRGEGVYERLAEALEDRTLRAQPTRDGAIQGLAALGGPRARQLLRELLRDPDRQTPRIAHALLRLGDVASLAALRQVALDGQAIVEMRMSAANAYTLLAAGQPGLARRWERDLGRAPPLGPPFEALDARMVEMTRRLVVAERCRADEACWAEALWAADAQEAARAYWQMSRSSGADEPETAALLGAAAARVLADSPPNERHDLVAGAVALLARLDPELARPHLAVVRRARAAWEGRTNPMGLPFDIPLALGQLERRLQP